MRTTQRVYFRTREARDAFGEGMALVNNVASSSCTVYAHNWGSTSGTGNHKVHFHEPYAWFLDLEYTIEEDIPAEIFCS